MAQNSKNLYTNRVRDIRTGSNNGTIIVSMDGTDKEVAVKGLTSTAFTNTNQYYPITGGNLNGPLYSSDVVRGTRLTAINGVNTNVDILDSSGQNGGGGWYLAIANHPNASWAAILTNYGNQSINGTFSATKLYNAVFNDYAEFYPRGEETEVGDIIALDLSADDEVYVKASKDNNAVVGVHSDTFGHIIGGENPPEGVDFVEHNMANYIPVGLKGRVYAKVVGKVSKGDKLVLSDIPGVAAKMTQENSDVIGIACESKETEEVSKIKIHLK